MNEALRSGSVEFKPRARLLKLIGEELISDEVVAITELVKNSYDADAATVTISFNGVTADDGEIVVADDGFGMDLDTLLGRWMQPAGSGKTGPDRITPKRRRTLGEKGVGRFAADKLGGGLELISRRASTQGEVVATFDWDLFDSDTTMMAQVKNRWEIRPATRIKGQGTILRITGLRTRWTERMFRRLTNRLTRLKSPFADGDQFAIRIESDEFPDYAGDLLLQLTWAECLGGALVPVG